MARVLAVKSRTIMVVRVVDKGRIRVRIIEVGITRETTTKTSHTTAATSQATAVAEVVAEAEVTIVAAEVEVAVVSRATARMIDIMRAEVKEPVVITMLTREAMLMMEGARVIIRDSSSVARNKAQRLSQSQPWPVNRKAKLL